MPPYEDPDPTNVIGVLVSDKYRSDASGLDSGQESRRATSLAEKPQSTRTVVVPSVIADALPAEPEPRTTTRRG